MPRPLDFTQSVSCYNGAFDSASQQVLDAQADALKIIRAVVPEAHVTYFPMDGEFVVDVRGKPIGYYASTRGEALRSALEKLGLSWED